MRQRKLSLLIANCSQVMNVTSQLLNAQENCFFPSDAGLSECPRHWQFSSTLPSHPWEFC